MSFDDTIEIPSTYLIISGVYFAATFVMSKQLRVASTATLAALSGGFLLNEDPSAWVACTTGSIFIGGVYMAVHRCRESVSECMSPV